MSSQIAIIQLSDIHVKSPRELNPILPRAEALTDAIASQLQGAQRAFLVISGDLAFSGKKKEYDLVKELVDVIRHGLLKRHKVSCKLDVLMVPGNHDCNFDLNDQLRDAALEHLTESQLNDDSIVAKCLGVQREYDSFERSLEHVPARSSAQRIAHTREFRDGNTHVRFFLLNSAWCSRKKETQSLQLPIPSNANPEEKPPNLVVAVVHHPYNWYAADNGRALRRYFEANADMVLTGHEHDGDSSARTSAEGNRTDYIEGSALQPPGNSSKSEFYAIHIDLDAKQYTISTMRWDGASSLYRKQDQFVARDFQRNAKRLEAAFEPTPHFELDLNDIGTAFTHPRGDPKLRDLFVCPDFKILDPNTRVDDRISSAADLMNAVTEMHRVLIFGSERTGKTCLGKYLFAEMRKLRVVPLLLHAGSFRSPPEGLAGDLDSAFAKQYDHRQKDRYWQLPKDRRAVIVDDYHSVDATRQERDMLLRQLCERFGTVVVLASDELRYEEFVDSATPSQCLLSFRQAEILPLGKALRYVLIEKWYSFGSRSREDAGSHERRVVEADRTIASLIGRDLVPSYPIVVLTMLQSIEARLSLDVNQGSYGHMYQALITARLAQTDPGIQLDTKINYLAELAYHMYSQNLLTLGLHDLEAWHIAYCAQYAVPLKFEQMLATMLKARVLEERAGHAHFRYEYIYLYFVARYIGNHISEERVKGQVQELALRFYQESAANIFVFLCHMSRDPVILTTAVQAAESLFPGVAPCRLETECDRVSAVARSLPQFALGGASPEKNRLALRAASDTEERRVAQARREQDRAAKAKDDAAEVHFAEVNAAYKTVQILGQIVRNFSGSLPADVKIKLITACNQLSLRTLTSFFDSFENSAPTVVAELARLAKERDPSLSLEVLQQDASKTLFMQMEMLTLSVIRHAANSVGMEVLGISLKQALEQNRSVATRMIDLAIKLDHDRVFPKSEIEKLNGDVHDSAFVVTLLRMLVVLHFYLFRSDAQVRQSVCSLLKISIDTGKLYDPRVKRIGGKKGIQRRFKSRE